MTLQRCPELRQGRCAIVSATECHWMQAAPLGGKVNLNTTATCCGGKFTGGTQLWAFSRQLTQKSGCDWPPVQGGTTQQYESWYDIMLPQQRSIQWVEGSHLLGKKENFLGVCNPPTPRAPGEELKCKITHSLLMGRKMGQWEDICSLIALACLTEQSPLGPGTNPPKVTPKFWV